MQSRIKEKLKWLYWNFRLNHAVTDKLKPHKQPSEIPPRTAKTIHLASSFDDRYAMPFAVMIRSLTAHISDQTRLMIYVLTKGLSDTEKSKLLDSLDSNRVDIVWVHVDEGIFQKAKMSNHASQAAYYRIMLADLLPQDLEKVIYLDPDLIVLDNLEQLWDLKLNDHYVLAVPEQGADCMYVSSALGLPNYQELGFPANQQIFNTGVLVVNLLKWRQNKIGLRAIDYLNKNREIIRWWDQDCLNAVIGVQWGAMSFRWNILSQLFLNPSWDTGPVKNRKEFLSLLTDPAVIHFNTNSKPWHKRCLHPYSKVFRHFLNQTKWAGYRDP